ncbi:cyclophilin-like protein [Tuber magnatum]|uniref:Cyclophilin-like protein n=1 Tax=Tuber magnatum TaxID=42249 RepID=A0A317SGR1_9PEZI|nr:cyclophilin-like protein [Tuber magnatum]
MATQYNLEPQTDAKVILKTTHGDLSLELWSKQTPLTTRNFLQLCLDGYYNSTIFHRLVPGFILQGGDPTSSGHGGEAIYPGGLFADEFHPRLKFNRRGLVGMANSGRKDDNGSQFFFTLGECRELTGRNTMFGKVVGETLYNLVRIGEMEVVGGGEKPIYDVRITSVEVLVNPFEDMVARIKEEKRLEEEPKKKGGGRKKKTKALLSFGGDEEGEEGPAVAKKPKFNTKLVVAALLADEQDDRAAMKEKAALETSSDKQPITAIETIAKTNYKGEGISDPTPSPSPSPPPQTTRRAPSSKLTKLQKTNAEIAAVKESLKRRTSPPPAEPKTKKSLLSIQKSLLPSTSVQGRKRRRGKATADDDDGYAALQRFKSKLDSAPSPPTTTTTTTAAGTTASTEAKATTGSKFTEVLDHDDESNLCDLHFIPHCLSCNAHVEAEDNVDGGAAGLWAHALSFEKDRLGKDLTWKKRNEEMVVIDPREKGKEILSKGKGKGSEWGRRRDGEGQGLGRPSGSRSVGN